MVSIGRQLVIAIASEDEETFYRLLDEVTDVNILDDVYNVNTPLGQACMMGKPHFVHALLRMGVNVNFHSYQPQQYPIHLAAKHETRNLESIELLFEYGANLDVQDFDENTALHIACTRGDIEVFDFLVDNGANLSLLNLDLETPLIKAILSRNQYMIESLVNAGCDVNYPNGDPLEYLIRVIPPMAECIDMFIEHGVSLTKHTYLNTACASNNIKMMKVLKAHGISVNAVSDVFNFTALHHACVSLLASHEVVELLLDWGAEVNVVSSTCDTPLHYACQQCNLRKVLALLDYNPDVNMEDFGRMTPLAALLTTRFQDDLREDYFKLGKLLIAVGATLGTRDLEVFEKEIPMTLSSVQTEQQIYEFLQSLKEYVNQPMKLQDLCRQKVRACLNSKIKHKVQTLPLPGPLKHYLTFSDII